MLKNTETGKYYTGRYDNFWTRDIKYAAQYKDSPDIEKMFESLERNEEDIFEDIDILAVEIIYVTDKD